MRENSSAPASRHEISLAYRREKLADLIFIKEKSTKRKRGRRGRKQPRVRRLQLHAQPGPGLVVEEAGSCLLECGRESHQGRDIANIAGCGLMADKRTSYRQLINAAALVIFHAKGRWQRCWKSKIGQSPCFETTAHDRIED